LFIIIIIAFNFISCWTFREYEITDSDAYEFEYFFMRAHLDPNWEKNNQGFMILSIKTKTKKTLSGLKNITVEKITLKANNITYNMIRDIYMIKFKELKIDYIDNDFSYGRDIQEITDCREFWNTRSIDFPVDEAYINACIIHGGNPGIIFDKVSKLTLSVKIKIELENGITEQIEREFYGKRKRTTATIFHFISAVLSGM
jgi:hypothetical protein